MTQSIYRSKPKGFMEPKKTEERKSDLMSLWPK